MGLKDRFVKAFKGLEKDNEVFVDGEEVNLKSKPSLTTINRQKSISKEIFKLENHRIDYRALNLFIKLAGALLIVILFITLINLVSATLVKPLINFLNIISPFILGLVFAWLLNPIVTRTTNSEFAKRTKTSRGAVSAIVTLIIGVIAFAAVIALAYITINEIIVFITGGSSIFDLAASETDPFDQAMKYANNELNNATPKTSSYNLILYLSQLSGYVEKVDDTYQLGSSLSTFELSNVIGYIASFSGKFLVAMIVAMYTLPSFSKVGSSFKKIIPKKFKSTGSEIIDIMGHSFSSYMRGALFIAFIVGFVISVGLFIISILCSTVFPAPSGLYVISSPSAVFNVMLIIITFGVICMMTNLVPYVGPFIGGFIVVTLTLLTDGSQNSWVTFSALGLIFIVQSLESLFLQPLIMGRHTSLHPVIILMGIAVFSALFGVIGMLISTPIIAVTRSVIIHLNKQYDLF